MNSAFIVYLMFGCLLVSRAETESTDTSTTTTILPTTSSCGPMPVCPPQLGCDWYFKPNGCLDCICPNPSCQDLTCPEGKECALIPPDSCPKRPCVSKATCISPNEGPLNTDTTCPEAPICEGECVLDYGSDGCPTCSCPPTCEGFTCDPGEECVLQKVACFRWPCFPQPICAPIQVTKEPCPLIRCAKECKSIIGSNGCPECQCQQTCEDIGCKESEECLMKDDVDCDSDPCFAIPTCVQKTVSPLSPTSTDGQCDPGCQVTTREDGSPDCLCTSFTPTMPFRTTYCPEIIADCYLFGCELSSTPYIDPDGCPWPICICPTETNPTTTETLPPSTTSCPEIAIDCAPGCDLHIIKPAVACEIPEFKCVCSSTTESTITSPTTPLWCPEYPDDCDLVCSSFIVIDKGCPQLDCECTETKPPTSTSPSFVTTTSPCPEPFCRVGCKYVPRTGDICPWCDCSGLTTPNCPEGCPVVTNEVGTLECSCPTTMPPMVTCYMSAFVCKSWECLVETRRSDGCPEFNCDCPTTMTTTTETPLMCTELTCPPGCPPVPVPNECPRCDCTYSSTTPFTTPPCPQVTCGAGCRYVTLPNGCPGCNCTRPTSTTTSSTATPTTPPTTTPCPQVTCRSGCRYVTLPNGCPGCNCTMITSTTTSTTGTSATSAVCPNEVECGDGCEKIFDQNGCYSCQCPRTCENVKCCKDKKCILKEVYCIKAPCFPVPTCVKTRDSCSGEPARGNCNKKMKIQWTYNASNDTCTEFPYYGCNPSPNTFPTEKKCINKCKAKASECQSCASDCYTLRNPGGCPRCICPNPCKKFSCPKRKKCKVSETKCEDPPCRTKTYCA